MNSSSGLSKVKTESDKIESKDIFKNLKSDYFLIKLFNNLLKKKSLHIIKYNKNIKNRINIGIKDYKEYSEIYSSIEIGIKLVNNKYGIFFNIDKENEKCYHIYLNDNKEEIKRNYANEDEKGAKFKIIIDYQIKSFIELFCFCDCVEYIYFKKFFRNNITNMEYMFYGCSSLKELNVINLNTNNITKMNGMFYGCSSLTNINLSNFYTDKVTNMSDMFFGCSTILIKRIKAKYKNISKKSKLY